MAGYEKAKGSNTSLVNGANCVSPVSHSPSPFSLFPPLFLHAPPFHFFKLRCPVFHLPLFLSYQCSPLPLLLLSWWAFFHHCFIFSNAGVKGSGEGRDVFPFASLCLGPPILLLTRKSIQVDEDDIFWKKRKDDDKLAWSQNSAQVTSELLQCFSNAMVGPRSWIGGLFNNKLFGGGKTSDNTLNPVQEARLQKLQQRMNTPFDETRHDHQASLLALWKLAFPNVPLSGFISEQWKEMGWQGCNPATDFRGCGFISLENLLFFAKSYPACFFRLLFKKGGKRAEWEYPFAVAGINISFMLIQMLDMSTGKPKGRPGINFVKILGEDENAFDILFCVAFAMMDAQWLAIKASYMEFNDVLRTTRIQLERELCLEDVKRISDIPAYDLLFR